MPKHKISYNRRCQLCILGRIDFEATDYWCELGLKRNSKECKKKYKIQPFLI